MVLNGIQLKYNPYKSRLNIPIDLSDLNNIEYVDKKFKDNYYTVNDVIIYDGFKALNKESICYHCLEVYMRAL